MQMRVAVSQPLTGKFYDYVPTGTYNRQDTGASCSNWEYPRIVRNIARNAMNLPTSNANYTLDMAEADYSAIKAFLDVICKWNEGSGTYSGTRPWLATKWNFKAVGQLTDYTGNTDGSVQGTLISGTPILANQEKEKYYINGTAVAGYTGVKTIPTPTLLTRQSLVEPKWVLCKLLDHVSRDLKKVPLNDTEKNAVDVLKAAVTDLTLGSEKNHYYGTQRKYGQVAGATVTTSGGVKDISSKAQPRLM